MIYTRCRKCIGGWGASCSLFLERQLAKTTPAPFGRSRVAMGTQKRPRCSGLQCPVCGVKGSPWQHLMRRVPSLLPCLHVLVGLFARLLFTSLKPFILFTVIYSHAEASHDSRRRKSQKTVRLKETSKHYKAPFSLWFCYHNIAIFSRLSLSFKASHLFVAADSAFKPVVLYFLNILPISS